MFANEGECVLCASGGEVRRVEVCVRVTIETRHLALTLFCSSGNEKLSQLWQIQASFISSMFMITQSSQAFLSPGATVSSGIRLPRCFLTVKDQKSFLNGVVRSGADSSSDPFPHDVLQQLFIHY